MTRSCCREKNRWRIRSDSYFHFTVLQNEVSETGAPGCTVRAKPRLKFGIFPKWHESVHN